MKRIGRKQLFVFSCLVLTVVLALPSYAAAASEEKPLTIGLPLPYTGFDPRFSAEMEAGVRLKLDEIGYRVGNRKVQLITADDAGDPKVAVQKVMKLVEQDRADVIVGSLFSNVTPAIAGYCNRVGVPYAPFVDQPISILHIAPQAAVLPTGTLKGGTYPGGLYAYDKLGYKTATVLYSDYAAGQDTMGGLMEGFQKQGGTIVQKQAVPLGTMDFAPYLTNLQNADVAAFWLDGGDGLFIKQFFEFKQRRLPLIAVTNWTIESQIMNELGDKALGVIGTGHDSEEIDTPMNRQFVAAMKKRLNGRAPSHFGYSAYITTATYLEALKATGGDTNVAKIIKAWRAVKMDTPAGVISFDKEGCAIGDMYVFKFAKEKGRYYWQIVQSYKQIPMRAPGE